LIRGELAAIAKKQGCSTPELIRCVSRRKLVALPVEVNDKSAKWHKMGMFCEGFGEIVVQNLIFLLR